MKNFMILFIFLLSSCTQDMEQTEATVPQEEITVNLNSDEQSTEKPPSIVPSDIGLNAIVLDSQSVWQDLDRFYKHELPKHENKAYYNNLKNMLFFHLIRQFEIIKNADKETLAFYTEEQAKMDFINDYTIMRDCLAGLTGYWKIEKIRQMAVDVHDKNIKYITNNFSEPDSYLSKKGYDLRSLSNLSVLSEQ